jgi:hypothetical protein
VALPRNGFGGVAVAVSGFEPSLLSRSTSSSSSIALRVIVTPPLRSETPPTLMAREK